MSIGAAAFLLQQQMRQMNDSGEPHDNKSFIIGLVIGIIAFILVIIFL